MLRVIDRGDGSSHAQCTHFDFAFFLVGCQNRIVFHSVLSNELTMALYGDPLAAAVAAAAELARNGGASFMFQNPSVLGTNSSAASATTSFPPSNIHVGRESPTSSLHDDEDDDEDDQEEEGAERRMARSRERNREHARRTRLRKKAQLEALQSKVKGLQAESQVLQQSLEECSLASILVGLSHETTETEDKVTQSLIHVATTSTTPAPGDMVQLVGTGKRKRFVSPEAVDTSNIQQQPLKVMIDGKMTEIGGSGRSHINWKTGVYSDEQGVNKQLTQQQLETLR